MIIQDSVQVTLSESSSSWGVVGIVVQAAATVTLAFFAGVQLWRERKHREERVAPPESRAAALAFLARRQLRSWLGQDAGSADDLEDWLVSVTNAGTLTRHLDTAEGRFIELLALAADLPKTAADNARKAAVYFFAGAGRINDYVSTPRPTGLELADWIKLRTDSWKDLRDCVRLLDEGVGAEALLTESRALDLRRNQEDPPTSALIARFATRLERFDAEQKEQ